MNLSTASRDQLLQVARRSLRAALASLARDASPGGASPREADAPAPVSPELLQPAGCFVSLHERRAHRLRGCIGRLEASEPLWQVVASTAVSALEDPRFVDHRITPADLPSLDMEISVLSPLRAAPSPLEFDLLNDGIYLLAGERTGCFLPQVARETGWSREQLLDRLCLEKMNLPPGAWREPGATLLVFSTLIIGPAPA